MSAKPSQQPGNDRRVIPFRPRRSAPGAAWRWPPAGASERPSPVQGLDRFEHSSQAEDDYPHRMKMNALALIVTAALVVVGLWLADSIAQMRKDQDCYLSGRRNCAPIDVPPIKRG